MASTTGAVTIQASVLHGAKDLRLETRSLPPPAAGEVQVAVRATGLCGSDLHYYGHFRNGDIVVREPLSLGHESSGEVVAVGAGDVAGLAVGDRVALEVGEPCGGCARCAEGRYNICPALRFRSSAKSVPHAQGTLQDRINHPAAWCHRLPPGLPLPLSALLEPLGVAIQATRRAGFPSGEASASSAEETTPASPALPATALVLGAGAVGLLVAGLCKVRGVRTVVVADVDGPRARFAVQKRFADRAYVVPARQPPPASTEEALAAARETAAAIGRIPGKEDDAKTPVGEVDVVFECTGVPACVQTAIYAARPGGKVMLIGMGTPVQTLPLSAAALREVDLCGVFRYAHTYAEGIRILSAAVAAPDPDAGPDAGPDAHAGPDFASLVTHTFHGLAAVEDAFAMASRKTDDAGRLVIKVLVTN